MSDGGNPHLHTNQIQNNTMNRSKNIVAMALTVSVSILAANSASAQNPGFELGNLFLGFQTTGSGSENYVLANIGDSALLFRDATSNQINLININAALTAQFGANWANRTDLFMGPAPRGVTTNSALLPATETSSTRSMSAILARLSAWKANLDQTDSR
jgi:hypothetical protein